MEASLHDAEGHTDTFRERAHAVYQRAEQSLKSRGLNEEVPRRTSGLRTPL
jgi:hypothetical protein